MLPYRREDTDRVTARTWPRSRFSSHPAIWSPTGATNGRWTIVKRGDAAAAADILAQVVETAPGFATAWFALASIRERLGDRDGAIAAFAAARDADREDYHGARLHLARLGVGEATPAMTGVYVRRLFDQHAPEFDQALVERLRLSRPGASARGGAARSPARRCGWARCSISAAAPGLSGAAFRPFCDWLIGRRHLARHGRAGARQGALRPARGRRSAGVSRGRGRRAASSGAGRGCVRLLQRPRADREGRGHGAGAGGLFAFTVETHCERRRALQATLRYATARRMCATRSPAPG